MKYDFHPLHVNSAAAALAFLVCTGCALHQPLHSWQLITRNANPLLIPPDLSKADITQRTWKTGIAAGARPCRIQEGGIALVTQGSRARITVNREILAQQPSGWLGSWATQLEQQQCIAVGAGMDLAAAIVDSVPLDPRTSLHLLYANEMRTGELPLNANSRIRLTSPLWRKPGDSLMAEGSYEITGHGAALVVTGRSSENLVGVETATYAVQPRPGAAGFTLAPLYADQSVNGATVRKSMPTVNLLEFPREAAFYTVFYKSWQNQFTAMVVAARSPVELQQHLDLLRGAAPSAACETFGKYCVALPKEVGLTVLVAISVNGSELFVSRGTSVFNAIVSSGEDTPNRVLPTLKVFRPWNHRPVAVAFDHADDAILKLVIRGGERISWR